MSATLTSQPTGVAPIAPDADNTLERFYVEHYLAMVRLAVLLVRDVGTAEDVVQDAFVALHSRLGRLQDPERAAGYLRQCVVNGARSHLRHGKIAALHLASSPPDDRGPDETVADQRVTVLSALAGLPTRQREVLALRYYLDLTEYQIAETLGITPGSVKTHASRGAAALRSLLKEIR
ncbi:MAG: SigE family RNA polymerase sigma factor [Actinomycetota bacterium]|nr:SigE family RNA polymerase sigma factor [Actinomycetota bacterium]MDQ6934001.1 SigE family RNA polymerase sigma factor [Actinomycetota bacterium]